MFENIYKFIPIVEDTEIINYLENIYILLMLFFTSYIILNIIKTFTANKNNVLR